MFASSSIVKTDFVENSERKRLKRKMSKGKMFADRIFEWSPLSRFLVDSDQLSKTVVFTVIH